MKMNTYLSYGMEKKISDMIEHVWLPALLTQERAVVADKRKHVFIHDVSA